MFCCSVDRNSIRGREFDQVSQTPPRSSRRGGPRSRSAEKFRAPPPGSPQTRSAKLARARLRAETLPTRLESKPISGKKNFPKAQHLIDSFSSIPVYLLSCANPWSTHGTVIARFESQCFNPRVSSKAQPNAINLNRLDGDSGICKSAQLSVFISVGKSKQYTLRINLVPAVGAPIKIATNNCQLFSLSRATGAPPQYAFSIKCTAFGGKSLLILPDDQ